MNCRYVKGHEEIVILHVCLFYICNRLSTNINICTIHVFIVVTVTAILQHVCILYITIEILCNVDV